ncbi:MAG: EMC3/TMCO1 family protein, partial [Candidatus Thorarchaeota archaeon]
KEARATNDPRLLQEVMDSQSRIMSLQGSMMSARCKPMLIFYIPFLLVFSVLGVLYGTNPVAILPFNAQNGLGFIEGWLGVNVPGSGFGMFFWSWYFLASLGLGNLIRKAGGLSVM